MTQLDLMTLAQYHQPGQLRTTPWGPLEWLGVGVLGVTERLSGPLIIWWVEASTPGAGHVARWLDHLPRDTDILVMDVLSPKLAAMLDRRGFTKGPESATWVRAASGATPPAATGGGDTASTAVA